MKSIIENLNIKYNKKYYEYKKKTIGQQSQLEHIIEEYIY
jgi:hypothetical protein